VIMEFHSPEKDSSFSVLGRSIRSAHTDIKLTETRPGEKLPAFPRATHGDEPGLRKFETVRKALAKVPRRAPNHDVRRRYPIPKAPTSPDVLAKTITTSGGIGNRHPSGVRPFTVREFACLQTFPVDFKFAGIGITNQKRQIGNAVPPRMAKALFKAAVRSLKETDAATAAAIAADAQSEPMRIYQHVHASGETYWK
jgi:site-specific DNA-cytosine methylase